MSQKNDGSGLYLYMPMLLVAAFLIGCLAVSLVEMREGTNDSSYTVMSQSDLSKESTRRKSSVRESNGLKYRWVSSSDTVVGAAASVPTDDNTSSQEKDDSGVLKLPNEHYINFIPPKTGYIAYLTFDDGPSENTEEILNILDYYNVKATFFVIYHSNMEEQYREIVNRGHTIALHTYTHDYSKVYKSETAFFNEITRISDYVYSVTGVRSRMIRFPGGSSNTVSNKYCPGIMDKLKVTVPQSGYVYHDWNVDTGDGASNNMATEKILNNVKATLTRYRNPDVLMHDGGEIKHTTVEALPEVIEYIYSQGYRMERLEMDSYAVHHNW